MEDQIQNKEAAGAAEDKKAQGTPAADQPKVDNKAAAKKDAAPAADKKPAADNKPAAKTGPKVRTEKTEIEGNPIVDIDGNEYEVVTPSFEVPGFGTFTNKEAATNEALLRKLIEKKSRVLRQVF